MPLIPVMQMFPKMVGEGKHRVARLTELLSECFTYLVGYENLQFSQGS